jgi:hypothetical protein
MRLARQQRDLATSSIPSNPRWGTSHAARHPPLTHRQQRQRDAAGGGASLLRPARALFDSERSSSHQEQDEAGLVIRDQLDGAARDLGGAAAASTPAAAEGADQMRRGSAAVNHMPPAPLADTAHASSAGQQQQQQQQQQQRQRRRPQLMGLDVTPELCAIATGEQLGLCALPRFRGLTHPHNTKTLITPTHITSTHITQSSDTNTHAHNQNPTQSTLSRGFWASRAWRSPSTSKTISKLIRQRWRC